MNNVIDFETHRRRLLGEKTEASVCSGKHSGAFQRSVRAELFDSLDAAQEDQQLQAMDEALERLICGGHGHCIDCKQPIGERRLNAVPDDRLCVHCQTQRERFALHGLSSA